MALSNYSVLMPQSFFFFFLVCFGQNGEKLEPLPLERFCLTVLETTFYHTGSEEKSETESQAKKKNNQGSTILLLNLKRHLPYCLCCCQRFLLSFCPRDKHFYQAGNKRISLMAVKLTRVLIFSHPIQNQKNVLAIDTL